MMFCSLDRVEIVLAADNLRIVLVVTAGTIFRLAYLTDDASISELTWVNNGSPFVFWAPQELLVPN
jgi:hypothetical protein